MTEINLSNHKKKKKKKKTEKNFFNCQKRISMKRYKEKMGGKKKRNDEFTSVSLTKKFKLQHIAVLNREHNKNHFFKTESRVGGVAQVVECLPSKCETLSSKKKVYKSNLLT
jgi:hypothetical protein